MPPDVTYDYAIIRVVPRVERGEQVNVGVILSCVDGEFLEVRIEVDEARLRALDPTLDLAAVRAALDLFPAVCAGGADAGPIGELPPRGRFRWLCRRAAPWCRSSPVHTGRTADPAAALQRLFERMVRTPSTPTRPDRLGRSGRRHEPTYFARGRISWPVAYCSSAWPIQPMVRPIAKSMSGAPGGSRSTRAAAASPKSRLGRSPVTAVAARTTFRTKASSARGCPRRPQPGQDGGGARIARRGRADGRSRRGDRRARSRAASAARRFRSGRHRGEHRFGAHARSAVLRAFERRQAGAHHRVRATIPPTRRSGP